MPLSRLFSREPFPARSYRADAVARGAVNFQTLRRDVSGVNFHKRMGAVGVVEFINFGAPCRQLPRVSCRGRSGPHGAGNQRGLDLRAGDPLQRGLSSQEKPT
jgi:hypothetical protein